MDHIVTPLQFIRRLFNAIQFNEGKVGEVAPEQELCCRHDPNHHEVLGIPFLLIQKHGSSGPPLLPRKAPRFAPSMLKVAPAERPLGEQSRDL